MMFGPRFTFGPDDDAPIGVPPAWTAALERFQLGYGEEFDQYDSHSVVGFYALLREEIEQRMYHEILQAFEKALGAEVK